MPEPRPGESSRLQDVIRRLQEAKTRAPRGSDASMPGPVADSGGPGGDAGTATDRPETGELFWRPFNPKALERTRPFRAAPPSRDEFESHLSQFLGARAKRTGPLFRAQGVTVRYGAVAACTDVDVELNDGEIVAVIGPNGAGKTALCDALTGFGPATGRIYLGDRDVSGLPAHVAQPARRGPHVRPAGAVRVDDGGREPDGGPAPPHARRLLRLWSRARPRQARRPAGPPPRARAARAPRHRSPRRPAGGRDGPGGAAPGGPRPGPGRRPPPRRPRRARGRALPGRAPGPLRADRHGVRRDGHRRARDRAGLPRRPEPGRLRLRPRRRGGGRERANPKTSRPTPASRRPSSGDCRPSPATPATPVTAARHPARRSARRPDARRRPTDADRLGSRGGLRRRARPLRHRPRGRRRRGPRRPRTQLLRQDHAGPGHHAVSSGPGPDPSLSTGVDSIGYLPRRS